jgi:hypothetical protein
MQNGQESFIIINREGKTVGRDEIVKQIGLVLPPDLGTVYFQQRIWSKGKRQSEPVIIFS